MSKLNYWNEMDDKQKISSLQKMNTGLKIEVGNLKTRIRLNDNVYKEFEEHHSKEIEYLELQKLSLENKIKKLIFSNNVRLILLITFTLTISIVLIINEILKHIII